MLSDSMPIIKQVPNTFSPETVSTIMIAIPIANCLRFEMKPTTCALLYLNYCACLWQRSSFCERITSWDPQTSTKSH